MSEQQARALVNRIEGASEEELASFVEIFREIDSEEGREKQFEMLSKFVPQRKRDEAWQASVVAIDYFADVRANRAAMSVITSDEATRKIYKELTARLRGDAKVPAWYSPGLSLLMVVLVHEEIEAVHLRVASRAWREVFGELPGF